MGDDRAGFLDDIPAVAVARLLGNADGLGYLKHLSIFSGHACSDKVHTKYSEQL